MPLLKHLAPTLTPEEVLSRRLWRLRDHLLLTWAEMAKLMGTRAVTVTKWKYGRSMMHLRFQQRLDELERANGLPYELPRPDKIILLKGRKMENLKRAARKTFVRDGTVDQQPRATWAEVVERPQLQPKAVKKREEG